MAQCVSATSYLETCRNMFREEGHRVTQPRLAVVKILAEAKAPLTAREMFEALSEDSGSPDVDQVSVYRILETLLSLRLVHQVFPSGGYVACLHTKCSSDSLHILTRCSKCEKIAELDIPQETIAPMLWYLRNEAGFHPDSHVFQMNGVCKDCG